MKQLIAISQSEINTVNVMDALNNRDLVGVYGEFAMLMEQIVRMSYKDNDAAMRAFREVQPPVGLLYMKDAVETHLLWAKDCSRKFEKHVSKEFFGNLGKYLPGAVEVKVKMNSLHMPDGFVKYNGSIIPVEVKVDSIVGSSVRQICRYIKEYKSTGGVVVAPTLSAPLPSNVIFVKVSA